MEDCGSSRLARLKKSLLEASTSQCSDSEGFAALHKSLNTLLDECSQAQRGSSAVGCCDVEGFNEAVSKARQQLQAKCELLQESVDGARAMVEDAGEYPIEASKEGVKKLLAHSHKLAYTSFAPLLGIELVDVQAGTYMPPFPQTIQMQVSFLKRHAQEKADAEAAAKAATAEAAIAAAAAAQPTAAAAAGNFKLPFIPRMPPGWKPGDPIPLPDFSTGGLVAGPVPDKPAEVEPPVAPPDVPIDANLDLDLNDGIDDDFILNAEAVEVASEEDSSDDSKDEEPGTANTADVDEDEEGRMESDDG